MSSSCTVEKTSEILIIAHSQSIGITLIVWCMCTPHHIVRVMGQKSSYSGHSFCVLFEKINTIFDDVDCLTHCRFIVRDFVYDTKTIKEEKNEKGRIEVELKREFVSCISSR